VVGRLGFCTVHFSDVARIKILAKVIFYKLMMKKWVKGWIGKIELFVRHRGMAALLMDVQSYPTGACFTTSAFLCSAEVGLKAPESGMVYKSLIGDSFNKYHDLDQFVSE
jgi:hypothetical protein